MDKVIASIEGFLREAESGQSRFFNEAELQHELGYWLRTKLPLGTRVYFERPVTSFFPNARGLVKTELDLVVAPPDHSWYLAIELKCPRNGREPDTMFDACLDLQFLEELIQVGFRGGLFVMHVDDALFYESGKQTGIYSHFRAGIPLPNLIPKPTKGKGRKCVNLSNAYSVQWQPCPSGGRYWLQTISG